MAPAVRRLRLQQKWLLGRHQWKQLLMRKAIRKLQRKWLVAWHQRQGPLVQVKKGCAPSVEAAADASCRKVKILRQWGPRKCLVPTDPEVPPVKTQRHMVGQMTSSVWPLWPRGTADVSRTVGPTKLPDWGGEICTGWCNESCVRGCGGCVRWRGRAACVDVAGISLTEGGRTKMRDKSI